MDATNIDGQNNSTLSNFDRIGFWTDLSGNGNHAEQSTESLKPTLKLSEHIQIGVDFDGSNDTLIGKYDEYRTL